MAAALNTCVTSVLAAGLPIVRPAARALRVGLAADPCLAVRRWGRPACAPIRRLLPCPVPSPAAPIRSCSCKAAAYWTGSAESGEGYFRPGTPHSERRQAEAMRIWDLIEAGDLLIPSEPDHGRTN